MNGRPIMKVSTDPQDLEPLMPNHLLLSRSESPTPPGLFRRKDQLSRCRWRQVQYLADIFWKRWSKEYLLLLQGRQKWLRPRKNLAVGDIVLVSVENSHRNLWPLGRIVKVLPNKKGFVRHAKGSQFSRDRSTSFVILLKDMNLSEWNIKDAQSSCNFALSH